MWKRLEKSFQQTVQSSLMDEVLATSFLDKKQYQESLLACAPLFDEQCCVPDRDFEALQERLVQCSEFSSRSCNTEPQNLQTGRRAFCRLCCTSIQPGGVRLH